MNLIKKFLAILVLGFSIAGAIPVLAADASSLSGLNATAGQVDAYKSQVKNGDARATIITRVGDIVGVVLSFVGIIFLVLTVYAGLLWMTSRGNDAQVEKAKTLLINAVIGLIVITAAYSLTMFIGGQLVK